MSENTGKLTVKVRTQSGKGVARKLRASGEIPAIVYGRGEANVLISVSPHALSKAMDPERKLNTFWELELKDGDAVKGTERCIIADTHLDMLRDDFMHVDFLRVDPELEVQIKIPVEYKGRAKGVVTGGKLRTLRRSVRVAAKPKDIPVKLVVDVSNIDAGESLRLSDLEISNTRFLDLPDTVMALVEMPRGKKEEAPAAPAKK